MIEREIMKTQKKRVLGKKEMLQCRFDEETNAVMWQGEA
jgi:hypothetical protein